MSMISVATRYVREKVNFPGILDLRRKKRVKKSWFLSFSKLLSSRRNISHVAMGTFSANASQMLIKVESKFHKYRAWQNNLANLLFEEEKLDIVEKKKALRCRKFDEKTYFVLRRDFEILGIITIINGES